MDTPDVTEVVNMTLMLRGVLTAGLVVAAFAILYTLKAAIGRYVNVRQMHRLRGRFVYRTARALLLVFLAFSLAYIWGFDPEKLWVLVTGFIGLVAIGFFAVWSLLSNMIAGTFLFLSDPFRINDEIEVPEAEINGRVLDIRPLFVVLEEPSGHTIYVPNNLLFQKIFRRFDPAARARELKQDAAPVEPEGAD